jgi:hypothetical protein
MMELRIRSQSREELVIAGDIKCCKMYVDDSTWYIYNTYCGNKTLIGGYASRERALEVIDKIENHCFSSAIGEDNYKIMATVYKMPKE